MAPIEVEAVPSIRTIRLLWPITAVSVIVSSLIAALLLWSANEVDRISRERDQAIVSVVLAQSKKRVAHAQESSTVWDEAVLRVAARPLDLDWVDVNLGTWFQDYAGHDEVYILDPRNSPLYAMRGGKRVNPSEYFVERETIKPLIAALRDRPTISARNNLDIAMLSPGAADLALVRGRPAIVSAKPVVTDTGRLKQQPGTEAVHVSVVYLDGAFINRFSERYALAGSRFSRTASVASGEAALPLRRDNGDVIGFFVWRPFAPGRKVTAAVAPVLLAASLLASLIVLSLAQRLNRKTKALEKSKALAQHLALHDPLTGLPNRAMFESRLDAMLANCENDGSGVALLYLDLDRFKEVNDTMGHPVGDMLLQHVGQRLSKHVRTSDTVARIGGDEFAIIIAVPEDREAIASICDRIVESLAQPFDLPDVRCSIGTSIGVSLAPSHGRDRTELLRTADIALYRAKLDGRGRFAFFSPCMEKAVDTFEDMDSEPSKSVREASATS